MYGRSFFNAIRVLLGAVIVVSSANAQAPANAKPPKAPKDSTKRDTLVATFFRSETPVVVTMTANLKRIRGDKSPDAPWRSATLTYNDSTGKAVTFPIQIRTRGIWRLKNCEFPPMRVDFKKDDVKETVFKGLDKEKLVSYCRDNDTYEQYLLQELQLYRIYRLLTPASHAVRLLRLTYADSANGKTLTTRYAFVVEDPGRLAERMNGKMLKIQGATPDDLEPSASAIVGLYQYLIGNTDFALSALHNAELLATVDGKYIPVVYDFDFAGAVNARYATVDPRLKVRSVRDRLFRGFCVPAAEYPKAVALFNAKKDSIYALYRDPIGKLLPNNIVEETLKYYDEFYKTINDPRALKRDIVEACLGKG